MKTIVGLFDNFTEAEAVVRDLEKAGYDRSDISMVANEKARSGVTANTVLPRIIDTTQNRAALPKADPRSWASPDEIAAVVVFLSSDEASGVTGAAIPVVART